MSIPLLPRLNEENKIAITKRGEWKSEAQNTLSNLVSDLKVTTDAKSNITSIPDLWARPAMYEMVLFDNKHYLHNKYVAEWRGILAMLAFREMRGFKDLKKEDVLIPDVNKISDTAPNFLKVVASMLPDEYTSYKDETIDSGCKLQILTYKDRPLGIIWPTILVCPAIGLEKMVDRTVSWWNIDGISDPISSLNDQEKALLAQWIDGIIDALPANDRKMDKVMSLLSVFKDELGVSERAKNYGLGTSLGITGFCKFMDKAIKCSIDNNQFLEASNVRLINRRGTKAKTLLVLTTDMYKQWNKSASDIIVAGSINLDSAMPYGDVIFNKTKLNDVDLTEFNAELRTGEDFFTDKICLLEASDDIFPNAISNIKINYGRIKNVILPVRSELLDYLTPEYIVKNFRISVFENNIKVELDLPLTGFTEDGEMLTISKVYKSAFDVEEWKKEILDGDLAAPIIQIWPNFIPYDESKWQDYYTFYDNSGLNAFYAEPIWNKDSAQESETRELNYGFVKAIISKGKKFPDCFTCKYNFETNAGNKETELGLILLNKPKKLEMSVNNPCKIGIDFGTTNTVTYMQMRDISTMIELQNRLYAVTAGNNEELAELRRHFFTASEQPNGDSISIRTLFNPNEGAFKGDINQAVFPGVIYYLDGIDNLGKDNNVTKLIQGKDMKWNSAQGIDYMKYFLYQMSLQCMAEAVAYGATSIEWYYSYPKAFSEAQINKLKGIWTTVIEKCQEISPNLCAKEAIAKTESISMAEFFKNEMKATFDRGMVCFDIGGGSTDIAIWQGINNDEPVGQCSLMFAGNDILNKQLFKNRDIILQFKNNNTEFSSVLQELYNVADNDYNKFSMQLEAILKYQQSTLLSSLIAKSETKNVKLFLRNIAFALSGIFYYAGIVVASSLDLQNKQLPHCFIGGNASKLLDWVDQGNYEANHTFEDVYTTCLVAGAATKTKLTPSQVRFQVKQSTNPKEEVAYGLVWQTGVSKGNSKQIEEEFFDPFNTDVINQIDKENEASVLSGEKIWVDGHEKGSDSITTNDVLNGIVVDIDLPNFRRFLNGFNSLIARKGFTGEYKIQFTDADFDEIRDQTNEFLAQQANLEVDDINLEPPFIIVLKQALELLSK